MSPFQAFESGCMGSLFIKYDADGRAAVLEARDAEDAWTKISRACHDHSDQIQVFGPHSLSIPWWQFLGCRDAIGYHVRAYSLEVEFDPVARSLLERANQRAEAFASGTSRSPVAVEVLPELLGRVGFSRPLTDEQKRNVSKLSGLSAGATFSVPGAGKTTEGLALFFLLASAQTRLLVIAPKNAFAAWERELRLCVPSIATEFKRLVGGQLAIRAAMKAAPRFMLITYHQLQFARSQIADHIVEDTWVYLDESHRIKRGLGGKIGNTVLSISHLPDFKLLLSGTPLPNSELDLVPQFGFLFPETVTPDADVASAIRPFYVRTTKSELGLRPPERRLVPVPMADGQRRLYRLARSETARQAELALRDRSKLRALGRSVIRLLQIASNPALVAARTDLPDDILAEVLGEEDSPKLRHACQRARELASAGQKVVIWTGFVANVELLSRRLADLEADYIHGGVDAGSDEEEDTREWKIKNFHQPNKNWVLIANPAACGEGISLHEVCHHAIYVDRNYNAAQYIQSEDRIHRLGLSPNQSTFIDILLCPDSIDESVDKRLRLKVKRMAEVLDDKELQIDPVSFDPMQIDDDEALDIEDAQDLLQQLESEERADTEVEEI